MLFFILQFICLVLYSIIAGQSFFYALGAGTAIKRLSANAFVEHRISTDNIIASRLKVVYTLTLISLIILLLLSCLNDMIFITNIGLALCCLLLDIFIATKRNVPINKKIKQWSTDNIPGNWEEVRDDWWRYFSWRMIISITGFLYLLGGLFIRLCRDY